MGCWSPREMGGRRSRYEDPSSSYSLVVEAAPSESSNVSVETEAEGNSHPPGETRSATRSDPASRMRPFDVRSERASILSTSCYHLVRLVVHLVNRFKVVLWYVAVSSQGSRVEVVPRRGSRSAGGGGLASQ